MPCTPARQPQRAQPLRAPCLLQHFSHAARAVPAPGGLSAGCRRADELFDRRAACRTDGARRCAPAPPPRARHQLACAAQPRPARCRPRTGPFGSRSNGFQIASGRLSEAIQGYPSYPRAIRAGRPIRHLSGGEPPRHRHQRAALRTRRALLRSRRAHAASRCQLRASRIALLTGYLRAIRRRSASLSSLSDCRFALDSPRARRGAIFGLIATLSLFAVPAARIARACGSRIACRLRGGSR